MKKQPMVIEIYECDSKWSWMARIGRKTVATDMFMKLTRRQAVAAATRFLADIHNFNYQFKTR